jgi:SAM-dependent methyltransferase
MRLSPWPPPDELRRFYPPAYWHSGAPDRTSQLEETYRRMVLHDHVRFALRAFRDSGVEGPVLDVGCGGGLFLRLLAERGYPVVGLDFSLEAASLAWEHHRVPVICGSLASAPLPDASCAAVTMYHVLEHLYDPASYLDAARRLLKPQGRLIVQVPNAACWQFLLLGGAWNGLDVPRHLFDFRVSDLELLLAECGFEVLRRKFFSLRDNPAGLASSLAPGLDPMARRVRGLAESPQARLWKNLVYFLLAAAALPFTLVEAACRAGSTIMIEARRKS